MPALDTLRPGQRARISEVLPHHPCAQQLLELGLTEGEEVEVVRLAPLGDPMEIRIRGYLLSVRRRDATAVSVKDVTP